MTVTAEHDDDADDEDDVTLTHTAASAADTDYDGISVDSVTVTVTDDDEDGVTIYPMSVTVPEGHTAQYAVVLDAQPDSNVTVTVNDPTDNTDVSTDPASLTFTDQDWDTPQLVTVTAAIDTDEDEDSATITHSVSGYGAVTVADDVAVTVLEADPVDVTVSFEMAAYSVDERDDASTTDVIENEVAIKVTLSADPERTVPIHLTQTPQNGATIADYSGVPSFLIFSPGETEGEFTFAATDDSDDDDDESVKLAFDSLATGVSAGTPSEATISITDDELNQLTVRFSQAAYSVREGRTISPNFGVLLDKATDRDLTFNFLLTYQNGASSRDFTFVHRSITVRKGNVGSYVTLRSRDNNIDDDGKTITYTFDALPEGVTLGTPSESVITIRDNDTAGVTVSPTSLTVAEGDDEEYTVVLDSRPTAGVTVTIGGTSGTDLTLNSTTLTFRRNSWNNAQTVTVTAGQDTDFDNDTATLTHTVSSTDTLYEGISADSVVVSITDDDVPSVDVEFGSATYSVEESDDAGTTEDKENEVTVTVTLSADPERTVTIPIVKAEQGGASSSDYSGVPDNVVFNSGDTSKSFTFKAEPDTVDDDGESVKLTFGTTLPTGVGEGTTKETVISINDDDDPSVDVEFGSATYSVEESDDSSTTETKENEVTVTVTLSADPERTVTIPIVKTNLGGASSSDYSGVPGDVTFNSGDTSKSFTFKAEPDTVDDDGESVKLTFGTTLPTGVSEGPTKETVVSINDDDLPADVDVEFEQGSYTVAEGRDAIVKITLSEDPERTVTIPINNTGQGGASSADYYVTDTSVTFNAGETEKSYTVSAHSDTVDDDGESVKLTFGTLPTGVTEGTTKQTIVSITDDDDPSVDVEFGSATYSVEESDDSSTTETKENEVTVTVTLSADPERTVTIPIVKTNLGGASSSDYSGVPDNVIFNSGDTSKTFTFKAESDSVDDDDESVKLTFGTTLPTGVSEGTTDETVVSINDDDVPSVDVEFEQESYSVDESDDATTENVTENEVTVTVTLSADPERTVTIPIVKTNLGGASSSDYSGVPDNVVFNAGDTEKSFTFSATDDSDDDNGESVKLTFDTLPSRVSEGTTKETVVSINDDDATVQEQSSVDVEFGSATYGVEESDDSSTTETKENEVTVTVTLSADPERTVTIPIVKAEQGGASSSDYSGVPDNVVFNSGDTSKSFTFKAEPDTVDDDGESVKLTFGTTLPTGVGEGTTDETVISINDDDDPSVDVEFGSATYSVEESDDAGTTEDKENEVTVTVTLSADPERTVTIPIVKTELGGASSSDYSGVPGNVTFNAGDTSKSFTFTAASDSVDDDGESVKLTFTNLPAGVTEGTTKETVVSINDDDVPSVDVEFGSATYSVEESDDAGTTEVKENEVTITVTLSADPERTVTIPIVKTELGGASSSDYSGVPDSVIFNAGDTEKSFTFKAEPDTVDDDGESVKLTFGTTLPTGVSEGTTKETVVSITDDDVPSVDVEFGSATYSVEESDDAGTTEDKENEVTVTVTLSADPERTVTIPIVKTELGGASSSDYSGVPDSVIFNAGDTEKSFTFKAEPDTVDDDGESVKLTFGTTLPTGVSEGTTKETVVSITDDDVPSVDVEFGSATYSVEESDDAGTTEDKENEVTVTVTLSADPERTVTIPIVKTELGGASSSDYSGVPDNVVFNAGDTEKSFTFKAEPDTVDDDGESVKLTFGTTLPTGVSEGTTKETVVSITDDDVPSVDVEFGSATYSVEESDDAGTTEDKENEVTVTVTLSADPERTVTIPIVKTELGGASSSDYSGVPDNVVFNAGDTEKSFTFKAEPDTVDDDDESVKLTFTNLPTGVSEGTTKETVVSITDDDATSQLQVSVSVSYKSSAYSLMEGSTVIITVRLSEDPERTLTIPVTTTNGTGASDDDYSGVPDNVVFNSGDTEKTFTFFATQDSDDEDVETVTLGFGDMPSDVSTTTPAQVTVSIRDSLRVSFGASTYEAHEGGDAAEVVVVLDEAATMSTTVPIELTLVNGVTNDDFSGVPSEVVFGVGERSKSFTVTAVDDDVEDDGEMITLSFGDLPAGVTEGEPSTTTIELMNTENGTPIVSDCSLPNKERVIDDWYLKIADMEIYLGYNPYDELGWKAPRARGFDVTCYAVEKRYRLKSDSDFSSWTLIAAVGSPHPGARRYLNIGTNDSCEVIQFRVRAVFNGSRYGPWGVGEWDVCGGTFRLLGDWY